MRPLAIVSDLDGTLLPRPYGLPPVTPPLGAGPAFAPLCRLLELGAIVVGVTGSGFASHSKRFFRELPLEARKAGRVVLAVETGRRLYRGSPTDGEPVEDAAYTALFESRIPPFSDATVAELVDVGRGGLARFFRELRADAAHALVDPQTDPLGFLVAKAQSNAAYSDEAPLSTDVDLVPRIEVREGNSAVVFVGVPSRLGASYYRVPPSLAALVDGKPTGRMCFDCIPQGLSKTLVLDYLIARREVVPGRAVCFGDQPAGNDEGLTAWHKGDDELADEPPLTPPQEAPAEAAAAAPGAEAPLVIPFVSVSERVGMVPERLRPWHATRHGGNAAASGAVLDALADAEAAAQAAGEDGFCVSLASARALVSLVNEGGDAERPVAATLPSRGSEEALA